VTDAVTNATTPPYEQWTVRELRDELRARGLSTSGTQAEMAARLWDADAAPKAPEPDRPDVKAADEPKADESKAKAKDEPKKDPRECVVDDGTPHTGRATPGAVICSAHAMRYKADGTPRAEYVKAEDVKRDE
jgi:hypothetical protein